MSMRLVLAFCALVAMTGCSAISAIEGATAPRDVYQLRIQDQPQARRQLAYHLIIELPTTTGTLDTDRIMIRPDPLKAQYLPGVRWSDPAPAMLQTLMLRSIESIGAFSYVGRRPLGSRGDYAILTELIDFQAELAPDAEAATVRIRMSVRLLRESDTRIVASRSFVASAAATSSETPAIVEAFDAAAASLMPEFTDWTLARLDAR